MTAEDKQGLVDLAKGHGIPLAMVVGVVLAIMQGMAMLGERDTQIALLEQEVIAVEASLAAFNARLDSERNFAADHRTRLFDRVQSIEARETTRQQDIAIMKAQLARMAEQMDRLTDALLPANDRRHSRPQ